MGYLLNNGLGCIGTVCRKGFLRRSLQVRSALDIYALLSALVYKEKFTARTAVSVVCSVTALVLGVIG